MANAQNAEQSARLRVLDSDLNYGEMMPPNELDLMSNSDQVHPLSSKRVISKRLDEKVF